MAAGAGFFYDDLPRGRRLMHRANTMINITAAATPWDGVVASL